MKRLIITTLLAVLTFTFVGAKNITKTVTKVTAAITLDTDVDYHISSATPFNDVGSINITNTEHAVVIMDALRPSLAKTYLSKISINGVAAKDGSNCQLKLYDRGSIVLPYGGTAFRPLTVFDQFNRSGESESNDFTEGHNGGFMKNVPSAWNNRIKSFRLKRGYMVTFALKKNGYGYSRCFIADKADLEMNLPPIIAGRISSYRIFKWYDTSKVGVADMFDTGSLATLNAQTTFGWGPGDSRLPDVEVVPHHIDESWPSAADCGSATYSPHMKTNNEPRNEADHGTWTMMQILINWQDLMRTGMRLCTPSSWDGSDYWNATGFLSDFLNEIDKRGWRCEIIDLHGYWKEGSFSTNVNNWAQKFGRPVWISEWVWGSSWNNDGIFHEASSRDNPTAADLEKNKTYVASILDNLNSNNACERYFYWNGEANCSKILRDGALTPAGEYFATMKTNGPGYTGYGNYIPKEPSLEAPSDLTAKFNTSKMTCTLEWKNYNGDLSEKVQLQRRVGTGTWETIAEWTGFEIEDKEAKVSLDVQDGDQTRKFPKIQASMNYEDPIKEAASYEYRVVETTYDNKTFTTNSAYNMMGTTEGTNTIQFGTVAIIPDKETPIFYAIGFDEYPALIGGSPSFNNTGVGANAKAMVNNYINSRSVEGLYAYAVYREQLWADVTAPKEESTTFIVGKPGNGSVGQLKYELGFIPKTEGDISYSNARAISNKNEEVVEVKFREPFSSIPVVMVTPLTLTSNMQLTMWRIWDVTAEGFKVQLMRQKGNTVATNNNMRVCYLAMEQGQTTDGCGHIYTVSEQEQTFTTASKLFTFDYEATNPRLMGQLQTYNHQAAIAVRLNNVKASTAQVYLQVDKTNSSMFINTSRPATEVMGFICISDDPDYDPNAIDAIAGRTQVSSPDVFTLTGIRTKRPLQSGLYIINGKKVMVK